MELDLATPFAMVRANWNRYCDQLQGIGYGGCTEDCYDEDEEACEECGDPECDGDHTQEDAGWSSRGAQRDRTRTHDRRSRAW